METLKINLDLKDKLMVRKALEYTGVYDHTIHCQLDMGQGPLQLSPQDLNIINNSLEEAARRQTDWFQAEKFREVYGRFSAEAHKKEIDGYH